MSTSRSARSSTSTSMIRISARDGACMRQLLDSVPIVIRSEDDLSRYLRTSWILRADSVLQLNERTALRFFPADEADRLTETLRKRNVFARHSWENSFYLQRARDLANKTVIEIYRPGDPDDMMDEAANTANLVEKIALLSAILSLSRKSIHRRLAIHEHRRSEFDLTIGKGYRYLRSKSRPEGEVYGIPVDTRFARRFDRCGFPELLALLTHQGDLSRRIQLSIDWLFESRLEPRLTAALVKTSIALESLLIFSESESLGASLAERSAFILGRTAESRQQVSRLVKDFYDARSGVVHGNRRKRRKLSDQLLEAADRVVLLLCLTIAANVDKWNSQEAIREWCESQRWGSPASDVVVPFPTRYLNNALNTFSKTDLTN